jgi:Fic family protein
MRQAGMTEAQIRLVESTGKPQPRLAISSDIDGVITEVGVRDGMAVAPGMTLFKIADLSTVWVLAEIPESQASAIRPGQAVTATATAIAGHALTGKVDAILSAASAHHRLLWIHPFLDGNGRVARLMTHAMLLEALDTGAVWSVARGFARAETRYKACLAACDLGRRNDLDGRGALSEEELAAFTRFFLETCLDQVRFMRQLVEPNRLRTRILLWVEEEIRTGTLAAKAGSILEAVLYRGELPRADAPMIVGATDRHARRITSALHNPEP